MNIQRKNIQKYKGVGTYVYWTGKPYISGKEVRYEHYDRIFKKKYSVTLILKIS